MVKENRPQNIQLISINLVEETGLLELCKVILTFKNWQTETLNSIVYDKSNGFLEGINKLTKIIKRSAFVNADGAILR